MCSAAVTGTNQTLVGSLWVYLVIRRKRNNPDRYFIQPQLYMHVITWAHYRLNVYEPQKHNPAFNFCLLTAQWTQVFMAELHLEPSLAEWTALSHENVHFSSFYGKAENQVQFYLLSPFHFPFQPRPLTPTWPRFNATSCWMNQPRLIHTLLTLGDHTQLSQYTLVRLPGARTRIKRPFFQDSLHTLSRHTNKNSLTTPAGRIQL